MIDQWLQQGVAHHQAGRLAQAEPLYARALALAPGHPAVLHLMGLLRMHQNRPPEALALMEQVLWSGRPACRWSGIWRGLAPPIWRWTACLTMPTPRRRTAPLFDTARTTRALEAAFETMFESWQRGEAPKTFGVEDRQVPHHDFIQIPTSLP